MDIKIISADPKNMYVYRGEIYMEKSVGSAACDSSLRQSVL